MSSLLKRVEGTAKSHLHNVMQIAVLRLNDDNFYGINVSKIRSFEDHSRYNITKNNAIESELMEGYIQYQGKVVPIINIEKWLEIYKEENQYLIYLVCEYNRKMVCFPIANIDNIYNVDINRLQQPDAYFEDIITYNALIDTGKGEITCMVLDVERLLQDTFGEEFSVEAEDAIVSEKTLLIAEDSKTATGIIRQLLKESRIETHYFHDGEELINHLNGLDQAGIEKVGLVITDLEMPKKDGYQVIRHIKETNRFKEIPVVVNSSMSNVGVDTKTELMGVQGFVAKTDPKNFLAKIREHIRS